jgi:signal transduction histidine kinase
METVKVHLTNFFLILKKNKSIVTSIFILFYITVKAESSNSVFTVYNQFTKDSITYSKYDYAKILYEQDDYSKALKKILPLIEQDINDPELEIKINLLAGKIFRKAKSYDNSLKYLQKSLGKLKEGIKSENSISNKLLADNFLQLSLVYKALKKKDSSKIYLKKIIPLEGFSNEILTLKATAFMNLGNMQAVEGNLNEAQANMYKSIEINKSLKDNLQLVLGYMNLANTYVEKKDFKEGRELYGKALTYLKSDKSLIALGYKEMLYDNIAWALYNLKDYRAYEYVTESYAIRDSLNQEKLTKDIEEINAKHNVDMAVQQEQIKIERQERKTWIIGVTGILVSLLLLYLANLYKLRQRSLSLKLSQSELEQQRSLERLKSQSQVKILNATIDGKETERKQIAEILHDNVSALLSSANMHLQASQKQFKDTAVPIELAKTQEIIAEASQKIRDLSHNLMSSVLLKFGLEYAVKDVAKKFSNSSLRINTAIHNVFRYSQDYEIKIFNIIQELINNILKHSQAKNAYVIMEEEEDSLNIIVKDDGVGFKNKSEEEKGVGINQIKARVHMMNGTFLIESSKGMGTKAIIKIPIVRKKSRVYSA